MILFRVKQLSDMGAFDITDEKANQLETDYKDHYDLLTDEIDKEIEKESLLRHLSDEQSRVDISYNKMNAFTTIISCCNTDCSCISKLGYNFFIKPARNIYFYMVNLCECKFMCMDISGD